MRKIIVTILFSGGLALFAQDFKTEIYNAYISSSMDKWKTIMEQMESEWMRTRDPGLLYDLTEAQYGYIAYCISVKKKEEARTCLEKAERNIQLLLVFNDSLSNVYSLQGAFYGLRAGLAPLKAPVYGKRSAESNEKAIALSPEDPQGWMEKANIEFYKPAIFGGSKRRSVPYYEKAVNLYEQESELMNHNWMYLNCMSGLANAYAETGQLKQADHLYRRILKTEPQFKWIREDVYPSFRKRHPEI